MSTKSMKITGLGELRPWVSGAGMDEGGKAQAVGGQGGQAAMWPQNVAGESVADEGFKPRFCALLH